MLRRRCSALGLIQEPTLVAGHYCFYDMQVSSARSFFEIPSDTLAIPQLNRPLTHVHLETPFQRKLRKQVHQYQAGDYYFHTTITELQRRPSEQSAESSCSQLPYPPPARIPDYSDLPSLHLPGI